MEIKYYHNPGFVYDLLFVFSSHYNYERHSAAYARFMDKEDAYNYIKGIDERFAPYPDELRLFFSLKDNGRGFMSSCYFTNLNGEQLRELDVKKLLAQLEDHESVVRKLIDFYFPGFSFSGDYTQLLPVLSPIIDQSKYDLTVKCDLYSFFVNPDKRIQALIYAIIDKERMLSEYYKEEYSKIIELQGNIVSADVFLDALAKHMRIDRIISYKAIPFTITLLHRYCIWIHGEETVDFVLVGYLYDYVLKSGKSANFEPDIKTFGEILSEPNRLEMLRIIKERVEVSQKDLERNLDLTGPTTYYHLSLMQKAKMLSVKNVGRYVYYSLNKEYFDKIIVRIKKLCEE